MTLYLKYARISTRQKYITKSWMHATIRGSHRYISQTRSPWKNRYSGKEFMNFRKSVTSRNFCFTIKQKANFWQMILLFYCFYFLFNLIHVRILQLLNTFEYTILLGNYHIYYIKFSHQNRIWLQNSALK